MEIPESVGVGALILLALVAIALLGVAVYLLVRLARMFALVRSEAMPVQGKLAFWAALIYTVFPVDVLPDPVYLDDIGVLAGALAFLNHLVAKYGVTRDGADRDEPVELDGVPPRSARRGTGPIVPQG